MPYNLDIELQQFISDLGFAKGEPTFFRLLKAKDFDFNNPVHTNIFPKLTYVNQLGVTQPRSQKLVLRGSDLYQQTRNGERLVSSNTSAYFTELNSQGLCPYIIPNPGGQEDVNITSSCLVFYENDAKTIEDQLEDFNQMNAKWSGGLAVKTRSSIHAYFRLDTIIQNNQIQNTQQRLIKLMDSDKSVNNPSRLMRVPGFNHHQFDGDELVTTLVEYVHHWDGSLASWSQVNIDLPIIETTSSKSNLYKVNLMPTTTDNATNTNLPSLLKFIPKNYRDIIEHGVPIGERNSTAKTLANVLIGAATRVAELGIQFSDTPEGLYEQYCQHCDTAAPGELDGIWTRTLKESPTSALTDDFLVTNNQAHYSRNFKGGVNLDTPKNLSDKLPQSQYQYQSLLSQELDCLDIEDVKVPNIKVNRASVLWDTIKYRYPLSVRKSIEMNHHKGGIPCYIYAMAYDTVFSGLVNGKYTVYISDVWEEQLNIFTWIVGIPGVNKSHIIKWLTGTLRSLNEQYRQDHKKAKRDYKRDYAEYLVQLKVDSEAIEPDEPSLKYAMLGYQTYAKFIAALGTQKMDHNSASNIIVADEATTLVGGEDGKVNTKDVAGLLSGFSGGELTSDTKCDGVQGVSKAMMSMLSTTQPVTLENICRTLSKSNGFIERILTPIIHENDVKSYNWEDKTSNAMSSISGHILDMYTKFDSMSPDNKIVISDEATKSLMEMEAWVALSKSKRAKAKSYILRLAGLYAIYDNADRPEIQSQHVYAAWEVLKMDEYNKEFLNINKESQTIAEEIVSKAVALLQYKGKLTLSTLGGFIHDLRQSPIADRIKVMEAVAKVMGPEADLTYNARRLPVLTLHGTLTEDMVKSYTQELDQTSKPVAVTTVDDYVDNIPSTEVVLESDKNITTEEVTEPTLEEQLTQKYEEQVTQKYEEQVAQIKPDRVYVALSDIGFQKRKLATPDNIYDVAEWTNTHAVIILKGGATTKVYTPKTRKI